MAANMIFFACMDLYQNDEILANYNMDKFSLNGQVQKSSKNPESTFMLYSDRRVHKYSDYDLNETWHLIPKATTPTINFDQLKELMLSTDFSRQGEFQKLLSGDLKFLDKKVDLAGNKVAFSSFTRTGNSLLRRIMERITGVFTGSDMLLH